MRRFGAAFGFGLGIGIALVAGWITYMVMVPGRDLTADISAAQAARSAPVPGAAHPVPAAVGTPPAPIAEAAAPPPVREVPQSLKQVQLSYAAIVDRVAPAVVNVYATTVRQGYVSPFANDPFFGQLFGQGSQLFKARPQVEQSLGSGVIVDPSGVIVTNSHVINGATTIRITVADGHEYDVDVVLNDTKSDLAVLKIKNPDGKTFPTLKFANSDDLKVGDLVLAIGNPFGVGQTVTSGIVSALARTGIEATDYSSFIQTDAAINPGNSGGALVDMQGRLVGINSAIYTRGGGSVGIGFAIPANMVRLVANAGMKGTAVVRPWLGARLQPLTSDLANSLGLQVPRGALVAEVAKGSAAEKAGLQSGDVITALDGHAITNPKSFDFSFAIKPIGSLANLSIVRGGAKKAVEVKVEAGPELPDSAKATISGDTIFQGVHAESLSPQIAQENGLSFDAKGVVITDIDPKSRAASVGLQKGDVIFGLNGTVIGDAQDFVKATATPQRAWQITMERNGQRFRTVVGG